jgi:hypothetical protein
MFPDLGRHELGALSLYKFLVIRAACGSYMPRSRGLSLHRSLPQALDLGRSPEQVVRIVPDFASGPYPLVPRTAARFSLGRNSASASPDSRQSTSRLRKWITDFRGHLQSLVNSIRTGPRGVKAGLRPPETGLTGSRCATPSTGQFGSDRPKQGPKLVGGCRQQG